MGRKGVSAGNSDRQPEPSFRHPQVLNREPNRLLALDEHLDEFARLLSRPLPVGFAAVPPSSDFSGLATVCGTPIVKGSSRAGGCF